MPNQTNTIVIFTDNHNHAFMGCAGHPVIKTPNLDALASKGIRFENAYCTSPLCCPSRAAIATGRYPHDTGFWDNAIVYDGSVPSWHHRVRESGAKTVSIGKLHFRSADHDNGFSEEIVPMHLHGGTGQIKTLLRATDQGVPKKKNGPALYDSGVGAADYQSYDELIADNTVSWLQENKNTDQPWVLFVSFPSPHPPFRVPQRFWDMYPREAMPLPSQWQGVDRPDHPAIRYIHRVFDFEEGVNEDYVRRVVAGYCGLITHVDEQIGRVIDEVESLDLMSNTNIVYSSDHGEAAGQHGIFGKNSLHEHSTRVPLIWAGPDVPSGVVRSTPVSHVDLFPTILDNMDVSFSEQDNNLPGQSLRQWFDNEDSTRALFAEFHAWGSLNSSFCLRIGNWKLIYHVEMPNQLFNLKKDPLETTNILETEPDHQAAIDLELKLRKLVDPEQTNTQSKADQSEWMEKYGGEAEVRKADVILYTPVPGRQSGLE